MTSDLKQYGSVSAASLCSSGLRAGVAKCDITVDDPDISVHDRLYSKALFLDDGITRIVIVCVDAVAIGGICDVQDDFVPRLRSLIESELQVSGEHVLVSATHTHPPGRLLCDDEQLLARTFDAVCQASEQMVPVRSGVGRGKEERIIINRNVNLKDGKHWTIRHTNPSPPDELVESLNPVDPEIGVLRLDRLDGQPFAMVFNYACHPLMGVPSQAVTANYPGFASHEIEQTLGGGAMALFLQGAAGDVIEVPFKDTQTPMHSGPIGSVLAQSTLKAWRNIRTSDAKLSVVNEIIQLPRRNDAPQRIEQLLEQQQELLDSLRYTSLNLKTFFPLYLEHKLSPGYPSNYKYRYLHAESIGSDDLIDRDVFNRRNLDKYESNILAMEQLARIQDELATCKRHQKINEDAGQDTAEAQVMAIRIGECVLVTAPIELLTDVGLGIKGRSPHEFTFVAAFANGYLHYGAPADYYGRGSYETIECLLESGWQNIYEDAAQRVLEELNGEG